MKPIVAIMGPGGMGASLGARLVEHGVDVRTSLAGRSPASVDRARAAGLIAVDDDADLAAADIVLSVVPPDQSLPLAERLASAARSFTTQVSPQPSVANTALIATSTR